MGFAWNWFARVDTNRIIHESVQDNIKKMLRHLVILCAAASASAFHAAPAALGPRAAPAIATRSIASPLCSEIVRGIGEGIIFQHPLASTRSLFPCRQLLSWESLRPSDSERC